MAAQKQTLDFIVVGAQKAGTTSLFHHLKRHPEISVPTGKEVPYFSHDVAYARDWSTYMSNLARHDGLADPARKWGTVTPQYMVGGVYKSASVTAASEHYDERTVPLRIHRRLPDVRLIAILRDPVARAVSHHRMLAARGHERRSFDDAIAELLDPDALRRARRTPQELTGYVTWGEYGRILAGYLEVFPREQLLVTFTDELELAPAELLRRIHDFVGVRADFEPDNLDRRFGAGRTARTFTWSSPSSWMSPSSPLSPQGIGAAISRNSAARAVWRSMPETRKRRLGGRYERIARRAAVRNRSARPTEVAANAPPSDATVARLRDHYGEDAERLAALLGVSPSWLAPRRAS
jgi:sulfotransferase family protein